jgi:cytochrome c
MYSRAVPILVVLVALAAAYAADSRSVWSGVYSEPQAERGKDLYLTECVRCHGETLLGGETGTPLVGDYFFENWSGRSAGELVETIRKTMPGDGPGVLSRSQSIDLTAYIFKENRIPPGEAELPSSLAALNAIQIESKP